MNFITASYNTPRIQIIKQIDDHLNLFIFLETLIRVQRDYIHISVEYEMSGLITRFGILMVFSSFFHTTVKRFKLFRYILLLRSRVQVYIYIYIVQHIPPLSSSCANGWKLKEKRTEKNFIYWPKVSEALPQID